MSRLKVIGVLSDGPAFEMDDCTMPSRDMNGMSKSHRTPLMLSHFVISALLGNP